MRKFLSCVIILSTSLLAIKGNKKILSFKASKKRLAVIYQNYSKTFYCDCAFSNTKKIIKESCDFRSAKDTRRSNYIEWEHIVPASAFGKGFKEWTLGSLTCKTKSGRRYRGRRCTRKMNQSFRYMEADLHNLVPAIGKINQVRSNYSFSEIPGEVYRYGKCDFEVANKKVEPRAKIRGDIARVYFYMDAVYPNLNIVTDSNRTLLEEWNLKDPVDEWECKKNRLIHKLQGNSNPYVSKFCYK